METKRLLVDDYRLLADAVRALIPKDEREDRVASDAHLRRALGDSGSYFIVCRIGATPIGYLSAFQFPATSADCHHVYLYDVVVDEFHRRNGVASRLIEELKKHCRRDHADHIWLGTSLDNSAAQKTFEATGARKIGETYIEYLYELDER